MSPNNIISNTLVNIYQSATISIIHIEVNLGFHPQFIIWSYGDPHQGVVHHSVGLLDLTAELVGELGQV